MKTAIVNIGRIVTGDWQDPLSPGDTILTDGHQIGFIHDWLRADDPAPMEWTALLESDAQRDARQASASTSSALMPNSTALAA